MDFSKADSTSATKSYDKPDYILLHRPSKENPSLLRVHKQTLPPFIRVKDLALKYLPQLRAESETEAPSEKQSLNDFARAVRQKMMSFQLRRQAVDQVQSRLNGDRTTHHPDRGLRKWITEVAPNDSGYLAFRVMWLNSDRYDIELDEAGIVQRVDHIRDTEESLETVVPEHFTGGPGVWQGRWERGMRVDELGEFSPKEWEVMEGHRRSSSGSSSR